MTNRDFESLQNFVSTAEKRLQKNATPLVYFVLVIVIVSVVLRIVI